MDTKKPLFHLLIRIGIFILLFIGVFIYGYLQYEHNSNEYQKHFEPKLALSLLTFILIQIFCLFLLLEMIYFFVKKRKILPLINLTFLLIIETPILILLYSLQ
jgi:hypothetical membrane protein